MLSRALLLLLPLVAGGLEAQERHVAPGDRVRLFSRDSGWRTGWLEAAGPDSVLLRGASGRRRALHVLRIDSRQTPIAVAHKAGAGAVVDWEWVCSWA